MKKKRNGKRMARSEILKFPRSDSYSRQGDKLSFLFAYGYLFIYLLPFCFLVGRRSVLTFEKCHGKTRIHCVQETAVARWVDEKKKTWKINKIYGAE